jgi:hypothetical protein
MAGADNSYIDESSSMHVVTSSDETERRSTTTTNNSSSNHEDSSSMPLSRQNKSSSSSSSNTSPPPSTKKVSMTMQEFMQSFSLSTLIDPSQPWVLVEDGSFLGIFDWVPRRLRVGPWSTCAICYVAAIWYVSALAACYYYYYYYYLKSDDIGGHDEPYCYYYRWKQHLSLATSTMTDTTTNNSVDHSSSLLEYPQVGTMKWYYHSLTFLWMTNVNRLIMTSGPLRLRAWGTYTVQSWTLLWIRHLLCACAPISSWALQWAEYIRFPVACSTTITFVVWNTILAPLIYGVGMKTPEQKRDFCKFIFSFRLTQIHVFNIVYAILNLAWASPQRQLEPIDLYFAILSVVVYMAWYLLFLDRLGIHLYAIFSPRAPGWLVVLIWTALFFVYFATFRLWQRIMWPYPPATNEMSPRYG